MPKPVLPSHDSASYELLSLTALCGEFPCDSAARFIDSESYRKKIVTGLTHNRLLRIFSRNHLRGYRLGIRNMGAYMRKMALSGYVLHVDLSPVRELVSLQRRCSNNLNQVAIQANTYGAIYPEELAALQRDYAALWGPLSDLLKQLSALVEL